MRTEGGSDPDLDPLPLARNRENPNPKSQSRSVEVEDTLEHTRTHPVITVRYSRPPLSKAAPPTPPGRRRL